MKSVSIFLTLVFLTGFQAAVLSEEPPPPIPEPNQSILEQLQEHLGKVSTQVTNTVNGGLDKIKGHASDFVDSMKRLSSSKNTNRKFYLMFKDILGFSHNAVGQSKEAIKDHYKKMMDLLEETKKHPAMVALNEEMVNPLLKRCQGFASWMGDQSIASVTSMVQKKFSL